MPSGLARARGGANHLQLRLQLQLLNTSFTGQRPAALILRPDIQPFVFVAPEPTRIRRLGSASQEDSGPQFWHRQASTTRHHSAPLHPHRCGPRCQKTCSPLGPASIQPDTVLTCHPQRRHRCLQQKPRCRCRLWGSPTASLVSANYWRPTEPRQSHEGWHRNHHASAAPHVRSVIGAEQWGSPRIFPSTRAGSMCLAPRLSPQAAWCGTPAIAPMRCLSGYWQRPTRLDSLPIALAWGSNHLPTTSDQYDGA